MNRFHRLVETLLGVILGFSIALLVTWWIIPFPRVQSTPSALHPSFKDEYRLLVALAYGSTGDVERARLRVAPLQEVDPVQSLVDQAVRFRSGQSGSNIYPQVSTSAVQYLALLARDLQSIPAQGTFTLPPTSTAAQAIPTGTHPPFVLLSSDPVCNSSSPDTLARIYLGDSDGQQLAALQIRVTWETGQQELFTGLKPEKGLGYADFIMSPGTVYSIQLPSASLVVTGISSPECISDDGSTYPGGLVLIFQQP
jgi:hypothetical protein